MNLKSHLQGFGDALLVGALITAIFHGNINWHMPTSFLIGAVVVYAVSANVRDKS